MLQDQDIKGFTLLELLVVVALISIITAIGIPNFSSWKKDREVRAVSYTHLTLPTTPYV